MEKKVNLSINEGDAFFSHEVSINYNPVQLFLDFKCITPRVDLRSKSGASINIKHNLIMVDPYHAKEILKLLKDVIKNYEKEFGQIKKPSSIKKFEKTKKEKVKGDNTKTPSYLG